MPPRFEGAGSLQTEWSIAHQNIRSTLFDFVTKHACDRGTKKQTDGQTDRQTELRQLRFNNAYPKSAVYPPYKSGAPKPH